MLLVVVAILVIFAPFLLNPFPETSGLAQFNAGLPGPHAAVPDLRDLRDRLQHPLRADGLPLLSVTRPFSGVGSYAAIWSMKLITLNIIPAIILAMIVAGLFAVIVGYISLRRSGIYFSILTLAFAQMSYALAYSVLTPPHRRRDGPSDQVDRHSALFEPRPRRNRTREHLRSPDARKHRTRGRRLALHLQRGYYVAGRGHADRLLPVDPHLPLTLRHDAARGEIEPAENELHRPQPEALYPRRLRHLGHVRRPRRRAHGGDGHPGRPGPDVLDRHRARSS